ncbi:winged helix-turn-helix transcriptional regulator [Micromonospora chokoriensis]
MADHRLDDKQRELLDQLFDKWSLVVLDILCDGPRRFSAIQRAAGTITPKSLTQTLRRLERNGIVSRHVVATSPIAVEYGLTSLGRTLEKPMQGMLYWILRHLPEVSVQRCGFDDRARR